jgi:hypothetical protein
MKTHLKQLSKSPDFWVITLLFILPLSFLTIPFYLTLQQK